MAPAQYARRPSDVTDQKVDSNGGRRQVLDRTLTPAVPAAAAVDGLRDDPAEITCRNRLGAPDRNVTSGVQIVEQLDGGGAISTLGSRATPAPGYRLRHHFAWFRHDVPPDSGSCHVAFPTIVQLRPCGVMKQSWDPGVNFRRVISGNGTSRAGTGAARPGFCCRADYRRAGHRCVVMSA